MSVLIDTNLLIYAAMPAMAEHDECRAWLENRFGDRNDSVELTWPALYGFMRLVTNPRVMGSDAVDLPAAWRAAEAYRDQPNARMVEPGPAHPAIAGRLIATPGLTSNDIADVHLAAIAIEHGLTLATHDHGFARFQGLSWNDPLTS